MHLTDLTEVRNTNWQSFVLIQRRFLRLFMNPLDLIWLGVLGFPLIHVLELKWFSIYLETKWKERVTTHSKKGREDKKHIEVESPMKSHEPDRVMNS